MHGADRVGIQVTKLHHVKTDLGRGRAWLRLALNEESLESYLRIIAEDQKEKKKHYSKDALVWNSDQLMLLTTIISGLDFLNFQIEIDSPLLDPNKKGGAFCGRRLLVRGAAPHGATRRSRCDAVGILCGHQGLSVYCSARSLTGSLLRCAHRAHRSAPRARVNKTPTRRCIYQEESSHLTPMLLQLPFTTVWVSLFPLPMLLRVCSWYWHARGAVLDCFVRCTP